MANKNIDLLIKRIRNSVEGDEGERFCFILGSGASRGSGIPSGSELEYDWMEELLGDPSQDGYEQKQKDVELKAEELHERGRMKHGFGEIVKRWKEQKSKNEKSLDPEFYFDIFELHEFFTQKDGQRDIERRFEEKKEEIAPSYGYAVLAKLLAYKGRNDVVITTNFDNLVEQALSLTQVSPIVVNHEALAAVIGELVPDCRYPIIGKIHRGIGYGIKNSNEETDELPKAWENALDAIFRFYTPIVIGYSGQDNGLMSYLENHTYPRGIIWCAYEQEPKNERIQKVVRNSHRGYIVIHDGFDSLMANIGAEICGEEIAIKNEINALNKWCDKYVSKLENTYCNIMGDANDEKPGDGTGTGNAKPEEGNVLTAADYFRRAYELAERKNFNEAIDNYDKAIELDPGYARAYNNRGYNYNNIREYDKAIADCTKAIELDPKYAAAYSNRGYAYGKLGKIEDALENYGKAIELDPKLAAVYNNRGVAYEKLSRCKEALVDYDKAIEFDPKFTIAYNNRGNAYKRMGKCNEAIADYNKAIELDPKYAYAYNNRGDTYEKMDKLKEALADYDKALELKPDYKVAKENRERVLVRMSEEK